MYDSLVRIRQGDNKIGEFLQFNVKVYNRYTTLVLIPKLQAPKT